MAISYVHTFAFDHNDGVIFQTHPGHVHEKHEWLQFTRMVEYYTCPNAQIGNSNRVTVLEHLSLDTWSRDYSA